MAWGDKTRKFVINEVDLLDHRISGDGQAATVTVTELSLYRSGKQNKEVVLTLNAYDLEQFVDALGEMLQKRDQINQRHRSRVTQAMDN